jgi:hypothetical protein
VRTVNVAKGTHSVPYLVVDALRLSTLRSIRLTALRVSYPSLNVWQMPISETRYKTVRTGQHAPSGGFSPHGGSASGQIFPSNPIWKYL